MEKEGDAATDRDHLLHHCLLSVLLHQLQRAVGRHGKARRGHDVHRADDEQTDEQPEHHAANHHEALLLAAGVGQLLGDRLHRGALDRILHVRS